MNVKNLKKNISWLRANITMVSYPPNDMFLCYGLVAMVVQAFQLPFKPYIESS